MANPNVFQKIVHSSLVKIIVGLAVIIGAVLLSESTIRPLLNKTKISEDWKNIVLSLIDSGLAVLTYILLFQWYDKRKITELNWTGFPQNAVLGFLTGLILQSLFIAVIYFFATYFIQCVNPFSFLLPALSTALSAGFVAEIAIVGVVFRLMEEKLGTSISLLTMMILFAVMHSGTKGATIVSVLSVIVNASLLLPATFIFTRTLWFPIFLHFAWDLSEPGIYGGVNSSISINQGLLSSKISGPALLTGGESGPQNSIQSVFFCLVLSIILLWMAKRQNKFISPYWVNKNVS